MFAGTFAVMIDNTCRTYAESGFPHVTKHGADWWWTMRAPASGNSMGKTIYCMLMPSLARVQAAKCEDNSSIAATQTLIALKCYTAEHGELPDALDQLVPDYLDAIPLDDFDGKPIRYSKDKCVLYSIGSDLVDAGGADEPTVKIAF